MPVPLRRADDAEHLGGLGRVHAGGRLVEQQQAGTQRERTRDLQAPAVGVGEAERRIAGARNETVAEQRQDLHGLGAQLRLLGLHRGRPHERQHELGDRTDQRPRRPHGAEPRVRADQQVVEHAQVAEHAAVLERAGEAERGKPLGGEAGDRLAARMRCCRNRETRARSRD